MNNLDQFQDITSDLHNVTGGGKLGTLWKGAKATYNAVRPVIKEGAEVVKDLGIIGGAGYAIKKGYDYVTGHDSKPAPATPSGNEE
jgi:hypothetical protein